MLELLTILPGSVIKASLF